MSADEARAEAERRFPHAASDPDVASSRSVRRLTFRQGAEWQASRPFTEEDVEIVAKRMADAASDWLHSDCGDDDHWVEHSNWEAYTAEARAALDAVTARHATKGQG